MNTMTEHFSSGSLLHLITLGPAAQRLRGVEHQDQCDQGVRSTPRNTANEAHTIDYHTMRCGETRGQQATAASMCII